MVTMRGSSWESLLEVVELRHKRRDSVLSQLVAAAESSGVVRDGDVVMAALARAHRVGSQGIGHGVAIPHARSVAVLRPAALLGRSERGVDWDPGAEEPVRLVMLVLSPANLPALAHADRVVAAAHALRLQRTRHKLLEAERAAVRALLEAQPA